MYGCVNVFFLCFPGRRPAWEFPFPFRRLCSSTGGPRRTETRPPDYRYASTAPCFILPPPTPLPLQPQRKKKPHQVFRRASTSLVNNQISTLHPLTLKTFYQQIAPYYLFPITFYQLSPSSILSDVA